MENLGIRSLTLPIGLVGKILEEWLNGHELRTPHVVKGVDVLDA